MSRNERLTEMFGTDKPAATDLRRWLRELRLADAYWAKYPNKADIIRLNYDMNIAQRALTDLGGSGA
jgi:hypothetical protein